ncbi:MFS transporter prlL [Fusarium oxysporum f. sp. albedinis]|nr:MFS transporter prlL [Fusarium oxysporum f. sp. albedinis]
MTCHLKRTRTSSCIVTLREECLPTACFFRASSILFGMMQSRLCMSSKSSTSSRTAASLLLCNAAEPSRASRCP